MKSIVSSARAAPFHKPNVTLHSKNKLFILMAFSISRTTPDAPQVLAEEFAPALISILIVNWNTRDLLRDCLLSLRAQLSDWPHEIIVVDNASSDNSAAMVRREFPDVILIANDSNNGFARGNNQGYEKARGAWIWLLNPDTQVLAGAHRALLQWLQRNPHGGAAASALIDARDGHIQRSCRTFPTPRALWCEALSLARKYPRSKRYGFYRMGWWNYRATRLVEQPMASSLMLRRAAIEDCGGLFDEQFPIFFNDVDLCWRLWESKWPIAFIHNSRVLHWGGAGTGQQRAAMILESHRSLQLFYEKHFRARLNPLLFRVTLLLIRSTGRARWLANCLSHKIQRRLKI